MVLPSTAADMRALLLDQYPWMADNVAKLSDFELLALMVKAYPQAIAVVEAEITARDRQLDEIARALFSPIPH